MNYTNKRRGVSNMGNKDWDYCRKCDSYSTHKSFNIHCHCYKEYSKCDKEFSKCEKEEHHCDSCVCKQLRGLAIATIMDVFLKSGEVFTGLVFVNVSHKDCCAYFNDPAIAGSLIVVSCEDITAIRVGGTGVA